MAEGKLSEISCSFKTCHNVPPVGRKLCLRCSSRANRKRRERADEGLCNHCNRPVVTGKRHCSLCGERARAYAKTHKTSLRSHFKYQSTVYSYYGRKCACCGEANEMFLTLDHINGREGTSDKKKTGFTLMHSVAREIIKGSPRTDIRLLCFNCNCGRERNGGTCPHQVPH